MPNRLVDMLNRIGAIFFENLFCLLPNLGVAVLCWSAPKVCLHWIALHACKHVRPCPVKYRAKNIALETGQCRTPKRKSQQWLGFRSWLLSPTPFLHNRTEWFDNSGPRTRWFDTLCFAPVGSWSYGLRHLIRYFFEWMAMVPYQKNSYQCMFLFVCGPFSWHNVCFQNVWFSTRCCSDAVWNHIECFVLQPCHNNRAKKTSWNGMVFVLHTVKTCFFGLIPIKEL